MSINHAELKIGCRKLEVDLFDNMHVFFAPFVYGHMFYVLPPVDEKKELNPLPLFCTLKIQLNITFCAVILT